MKVDFSNPETWPKEASERVAPKPGRAVVSDSSDRQHDVSRNLTPYKVDRIMTQANAGDTRDLCKLASEIEEKNWTIKHCMETRVAAVAGASWDIEPSADDAKSNAIAAELKTDLENAGGNRLDTFGNLLADMAYSVLPGRSCSEIIWQTGGRLHGFSSLPAKHLLYPSNGAFGEPVISTDSGNVPMPPAKFVLFHRRASGGDPARAGLVRTLAWLHCFMNINFKDMLRFIERYGMPFLVAKVDQQSWENERNQIKSVIRNFGPDGGGVFTRSTELELLQANAANGDIYFKLIEYCEAAITKVILGQTASSGDGGGWSKDNAQSQVRQDLLESDCALIADVVNEQIAKPWLAFNYPNAASPIFEFLFEADEDTKALAEMVKTLFDAGLEADTEELSRRFKIKLTRKAGLEVASPPQKKENKEALSLAGETTSEATEQRSRDLSLMAENALNQFQEGSKEWAEKIIALVENAIEDESGEALKALADTASNSSFATEKLSKIIENTVYASAASGAALKLDALSKHIKPKDEGK